jgi:hypothetical protein
VRKAVVVQERDKDEEEEEEEEKEEEVKPNGRNEEVGREKVESRRSVARQVTIQLFQRFSLWSRKRIAVKSSTRSAPAVRSACSSLTTLLSLLSHSLSTNVTPRHFVMKIFAL